MADDDPLLSEGYADEVDPEYPVEDDGRDEAPFEYDLDEPNLVATFMAHPRGKEALKNLSKVVRECYDEGREGTEQYRERFGSDWRLFTGDLPPKTGPHQHSANVHNPLMLKAITRKMFRAQSELFGDWSEPIEFEPTSDEPMAIEIARVRTRHTLYQFREELPDFRRQIQRGMLLFFTAGDVTAESYYDKFTRRNRHEILTVDEFMVPYVYCSTAPDFSDCPWRIRVLNKHRHELQAERDDFYDVDKVIKREAPGWEDEPDMLFREVVAEIEGIEAPTSGHGAAYRLVQWDGWTDELPGQDRDVFVRVVMDLDTGGILKLQVLEEDDPADAERYERQLAELEEFRAAVERYEALQEELQAMGPQIEQAQAIAAQMGMSLPPELDAMMNTPAPQPPEWLEEPVDEDGEPVDDEAYVVWLMEEAMPEPPRRQPIHMFAHGVNIEPLVGNLGIGDGRMQADFNRAANIALQQFVDQATAANIPRTYLDAAAEPDRPNVIYEPGAFVKIKPPSGQKLTDAMVPIRGEQANGQLLQVVQLMDEYAEDAAQSPEVLSGNPGKSGETFRGISARIEQATTQLRVPTANFAHFYKQIVKNNSRLNAMFLPDEQQVRVPDPVLQRRVPITVRREIYEHVPDVVVKADLRFISHAERVREAMELLQMPKAVPALATNLNFWWHAAREFLKLQRRWDLIRALGPEPPPPTTPFGMPMAVDPVTGQPMLIPPGAQPPGGPPPGGPAPGGRPAGPPRARMRPPAARAPRQVRRPGGAVPQRLPPQARPA